MCKRCNETRSWTYTTKLQDKYTKNTINAVPFKKISVDMLGSIDAKTYPESRNTYKVYPLLVKCIETGALWAGLLEATFGEFTSIIRDAGSNLFKKNHQPINCNKRR